MEDQELETVALPGGVRVHLEHPDDCDIVNRVGVGFWILGVHTLLGGILCLMALMHYEWSWIMFSAAIFEFYSFGVVVFFAILSAIDAMNQESTAFKRLANERKEKGE